jgi:hypothetical protein
MLTVYYKTPHHFEFLSHEFPQTSCDIALIVCVQIDSRQLRHQMPSRSNLRNALTPPPDHSYLKNAPTNGVFRNESAGNFWSLQEVRQNEQNINVRELISDGVCEKIIEKNWIERRSEGVVWWESVGKEIGGILRQNLEYVKCQEIWRLSVLNYACEKFIIWEIGEILYITNEVRPGKYGRKKAQKISCNSRLGSAGTKKLASSMRNPVLSRILAFLGKSTTLRARSTPNSGMVNPILRTEFSFYVDIYVNRR